MLQGMRKLDFNRVCVYDSTLGGDVIVDFPTDQQWKMKIENIRFTLPAETTWQDPIGFIKIYSEGSHFIGNVVVNGDIKVRDTALPLIWPDQVGRQQVIGLFRGLSNAGPVGFNFALLDKDKKKLTLDQLIVIFSMVAEDGKV
jgi:hypothetical protein